MSPSLDLLDHLLHVEVTTGDLVVEAIAVEAMVEAGTVLPQLPQERDAKFLSITFVFPIDQTSIVTAVIALM